MTRCENPRFPRCDAFVQWHRIVTAEGAWDEAFCLNGHSQPFPDATNSGQPQHHGVNLGGELCRSDFRAVLGGEGCDHFGPVGENIAKGGPERGPEGGERR